MLSPFLITLYRMSYYCDETGNCGLKKEIVPLAATQTSDRSQSGRIHRLKGKSIARFRQQNPTAAISQFKQPSARLSLIQGQADIPTYDAHGEIRALDAGCCASNLEQ